MIATEKKTYSVKTRFIFEGTFEVKADKMSEARKMVQENCGMVIGSGINTTLYEDEIDWNFSMNPIKKTGAIRCIAEPTAYVKREKAFIENCHLEYDTNCTEITIKEWKKLMDGARRCSYKKLVALIKEEEPSIYRKLALEFFNPFYKQSRHTSTHYILVHSGIEYFFRKK